MDILVDPIQLDAMKGTRLPARQSTLQKQEIMKEHLDTMLENNVIEASTATKWGQCLLTPKNNGKFRFVADLTNVNACSSNEGWPIPSIPEMIQRIGDKKPKIFGILDLTSGYHQAPLIITLEFQWASRGRHPNSRG